MTFNLFFENQVQSIEGCARDDIIQTWAKWMHHMCIKKHWHIQSKITEDRDRRSTVKASTIHSHAAVSHLYVG